MKLGMNLVEYWAIPKRECTSDTFLGRSICFRAWTLLSDGLLPSFEKMTPKNSIWGRLSLHFLGLKVRPHSQNWQSRFSRALSWSTLPLPKTMKLSLINACILISFGLDIKCWTACVACAVMELCEAETVDVPAAAVLCGTELLVFQRHFVGSELPVFRPHGPTWSLHQI